MNLRETVSTSFLEQQQSLLEKLRATYLLLYFPEEMQFSVVNCLSEGLSGDPFTRSTMSVSIFHWFVISNMSFSS